MSANAQSRRSLLLAGLSAPVGAVMPAALARASGPDPVFALIEAENQAFDALNVSIHELGKAEQAHWAKRDDIVAERRKDEADERNGAALDVAMDAAHAVYRAIPTTAAGLLAMIRLFEDREMEIVGRPQDEMLEGIFNAVRILLTTEGRA
jgi:hypothetical protein